MKAAVLFCHTDEQEPNAAVERELGRQYTQLSQYSSFAGFLKRELGKFAPAQEHPV